MSALVLALPHYPLGKQAKHNILCFAVTNMISKNVSYAIHCQAKFSIPFLCHERLGTSKDGHNMLVMLKLLGLGAAQGRCICTSTEE